MDRKHGKYIVNVEHSENQPVTQNFFTDRSLWKIFLACLLACAITTTLGVLIECLVYNGKNNNTSIVIQLPQNHGTTSSTITASTTTEATTTTVTSTKITTTTATTTTSFDRISSLFSDSTKTSPSISTATTSSINKITMHATNSMNFPITTP
ncbi:Hypothetical predicted protein [Lynx pardinus]|uniref:CLLAC-motif containing domain-containing protein n=1 Tax=Lynx pardinus TaxID=191816 RepID=A0A485NWK4_LYNPA|nr:Hypothetical predicted protein [Lynx pardinus]